MIPSFNISGVLPPHLSGPTARIAVSPYQVSVSELVVRFSTSPERISILKGFLNYRMALRNIGIVRGFQWLDGSFMEDIETTEARPPGDLDIVTFAYLPSTVGKPYTHAMLFNPDESKKSFLCDAYFVDLGKSPETIVDDSRYWFGLFSHQRVSGLWKGMLKVDLVSDDATVSFPDEEAPSKDVYSSVVYP